MERYVLWEALQPARVAWRFVMTSSGTLSVAISGESLMREWCADNLATPLEVDRIKELVMTSGLHATRHNYSCST